MGITNYAAFLIASSLFILSPGIDTMFILNKSISQGKKFGFYSALGITTGVLIHTTLAAFGLSLILAKSAMAFSVIKYLGAAYLIYLGVAKLISTDSVIKDNKPAAIETIKRSYLSAIVTNTFNPKVAIFFLAFFPQFIQPGHLHNAMPFILLGCSYAVMGFIWLMVLSLFAGTFAKKLKANSSLSVWLNKVSAMTFIMMGVKIAFTRK